MRMIKKQILLVVGVTCLLFVLIFYKTIFQEGNPIPLAVGMAKMKTGNEKVVQVSDKPEKYLIHSDDYLSFIKEMDKKGDTFQYQEDELFYFDREEKRASFERKSYTNRYMIMELK